MNKLWLLLALGASAGCADPAIDLSLRLPTASQMPATFDLSCVTAVDVVVAGNDHGTPDSPADVINRCIEITTPPSSFAALRAAIAGRLEINLPQSGLAAITLRGRSGTCTEEFPQYESIFYGGAPYSDGSESMTIPVVANISCNARKTYAVSTVDLMALGTTKTCAMAVPAAAGMPEVFTGNIRPQLMGPDFPLTKWEDGASYSPINAAGKGTLDGYTGASTTRSCAAIGFFSTNEEASSCINPSAPTLCAGPNELEVGVINYQLGFASAETALMQQYGRPVFGAVWKQSPAATLTKAPIVGATVELEDPTQGKVVYVEPGANKLNATAGATATGASGMFMIYLKGEATYVLVKSGGSQQRFLVASSGLRWSTLLAVLP